MLSADRLLGALVLVKAVDVLDRGPQRFPSVPWALVLGAWALAGLVLLVRPHRLAWAAVVAAGVGIACDFPTDLRRQHLVLMIGVALAAAVAADERERLLLWRVQLSVLYGIAFLAKLNESYLTGNVLAAAGGPGLLPTPGLALLITASILLLLLEGALAVLLWTHPRPGLVLAGLLHCGILVLVTPNAEVFVRLLFFGGVAVVVYAACARVTPLDKPEDPAARCSRPAQRQ